MNKVVIGSKEISSISRPFIIAEAGVNYENDMDVAKEMIAEAAQNGADAIKFQTYKAETIAAKESPAYWDTNKTQREFFKQYDSFGEDEYRELAKESKRHNIIFLSTPFDINAVDFLDPLMPAYKIASADLTNIPFIRYIAKKNKPMLLSTGAATIGEIDNTVTEINRINPNVPIVLLHCILSYPTAYKDANLRMITHLKKIFPDLVIGYSDHTLPDRGMITLVVAALMGASILEKHFTLDKTLPGNDHYHAMDPDDLQLLRYNLDLTWQILGKSKKEIIESELPARQNARRSIVAKRDIKKGSVITEEDLTTKRPGTGISPLYFDLLIGKKVIRDIKEDKILTWEDFFL